MILPSMYFLKEIIEVVGIVISGVLLAKLFDFIAKVILFDEDFLNAMKNIGITKTYLEFAVSLIRYLIYLIFGLLALAQIGFATLMFRLIALSIALVILITLFLSFKDFVKNGAAGIFISMANLFKEGDKIRFNGVEGEVVKFTLLTTTLKTKDGVLVIPNSMLVGKKLWKAR